MMTVNSVSSSTGVLLSIIAGVDDGKSGSHDCWGGVTADEENSSVNSEELNVGPTVFAGVQDNAAGFVIDQLGVTKLVSSAGASQTRSCSRAWILRSRYSIVR